jgi:hypothetical protein
MCPFFRLSCATDIDVLAEGCARIPEIRNAMK